MSKRSRSNRNVLDEDNDDSYESIIPTPNRHRKQGKQASAAASVQSSRQSSEAQTDQYFLDEISVGDDIFSREELKRIEEENRQAKRMRKKVEIANNWNRAINAIYPLFTDVFAEPGPALNATAPFPAKVSSSMHRTFADAYNAYLMVKDMVDTDLQSIYDFNEGDCVACPSADEISDSAGNRLIITIDGNFGLKKTKTGEQPSAYHVQTMVKRYFSADEKVAKYANNNEYTADDNDDYCEALKNADPKRTFLAQSHFAINGVLGSLCARHAVPQKFANIHQ
ncbi:hypothetical protein BJV82DRAFT_674258 [Fennellomyces sp. T-0311]|nr:hypothetical protein BJV82DRAFT_674258 [Fennellomyces sp. T-0311]